MAMVTANNIGIIEKIKLPTVNISIDVSAEINGIGLVARPIMTPAAGKIAIGNNSA
ncbi:hypothetical protein TUM4644_12170 [Shewanella colwelliana]|nr:hypothetical protein TUM4644_12170 [Shewanella colwelliana]